MVSIITVNYNCWQDTCEMIASFKQYETYPYEMIVIDNASQNDDAAQIVALYPEVIVVRSDKNIGFAGGNNLGYRYAKGDYIFFLNNDILLQKPVLQPLVQRLQEKCIGGVSPMIRFSYPPYEVQYYGHQKMSAITLKHTTPPYDPLHPENYLVDREVEVMHGAAMMLRRDVIENVGLMTEVYFLFYEEFDWSYELLKKKYRIWYEPASVVFHKEGRSIGKITPLRIYYLSRGRLIFARRQLSGIRKWISCLYLLGPVVLRNCMKYIRNREWKLLMASLKGTVHGIGARKK